MASLLTQTQKDQYNTVMNDVHDTWAREITAYKSAVKTVPTPDLGYNSIYGTRGPTQPVTFTPESFTLNARILYGKKAEEEYLSDEAVDVQNKLATRWASIKASRAVR